VTSYFSTPERIEGLQTEARSWIGTPFFPNGSAKGLGVSCQKLAALVYRGAGLYVPDVPDGPMTSYAVEEQTIVAQFVDGLPMFARVDPHSLQVGDLIHFIILRGVPHLGIVVSEGQFLHTMIHSKVCIRPLADPTWQRRVTIAWRPTDA